MPTWSNVFYTADDFWNSIWEGYDRLVEMLAEEESRCASDPEQIVLAGYSQGALVIHLVLGFLGSSASLDDPALISAVALVADPARLSDGGGEIRKGDAAQTAEGVWVKGLPSGSGLTPPIPSTLRSRTISVCHNHDIVCAPGWGASSSHHTDYSTSDLNPLGVFAGSRSGFSLP